MGETTWDGFLHAPENELAWASVSALARKDPMVPPILILHGASGVGKTRLLTGLLNERLARHPGDATAFLSGEEFAHSCSIATQQPGGWSELRARFRDLDFLAIDDLHKLDRSVLALGELLHTIDALEIRGATVAVTSRVAPGQWDHWPVRLVNRFLAGLSIKVEAPGPVLRRRFLLDRLRSRSLSLTADAVDFLAESADGFRVLDGWISMLRLATRVERLPMTRAAVETLITSDALPLAPSAETIAKAVAQRFDVPLRDLRGPSRRSTLVEPRHLAIYLIRNHTKLSFNAIGTYFGNRDPKTIRHACQAAELRLKRDPAVDAVVETLRRTWNPVGSLSTSA